MPITMQISGRIADYIRLKGIIRTVYIRKLFNCGGFLLAAGFMVGTAYAPTPIAKIACLTLGVASTGISWIGFG